MTGPTDSARLLAVLPDSGMMTFARACYRSGLSTEAARRAVLELVTEGLVIATLDSRAKLEPDQHTLLELTDDGRRARAEEPAE